MIVLLLVDDDEMARGLIGSQLSRLGYVVIAAASGRDGVRATRGESPDLVLMDLSMPEMDGFEAIRQLKTHGVTSHIPIIAMTALNTDVSVRRAALAGCDSYETKPVDLVRLNRKILDLVPSSLDR
jgi:two-component system cell cycle response regulator DivK